MRRALQRDRTTVSVAFKHAGEAWRIQTRCIVIVRPKSRRRGIDVDACSPFQGRGRPPGRRAFDRRAEAKRAGRPPRLSCSSTIRASISCRTASRATSSALMPPTARTRPRTRAARSAPTPSAAIRRRTQTGTRPRALPWARKLKALIDGGARIITLRMTRDSIEIVQDRAPDRTRRKL